MNNIQNQRGAALIPLLVILVVLLAGTTGYFAFVRERHQVSVDDGGVSDGVPATTNEGGVQNVGSGFVSASWRTYENKKYGLKFQYPGEWVMQSESSDQAVHAPLSVVFSAGFSQLKPYNMGVSLMRSACDGSVSVLEGEAFSLGGKINNFVVDGYQTEVYHTGCYECYGDEPIMTDGTTALVCSREGVSCFGFKLSGPKEKYEDLKGFFINDFLPRIDIGPELARIGCYQSKGAG